MIFIYVHIHICHIDVGPESLFVVSSVTITSPSAFVCVATPCNTLQHPGTPWNTLQHPATHCNTLQHTATHTAQSLLPLCFILYTYAGRDTFIDVTQTQTPCLPLKNERRIGKHCNTLQHTAKHHYTLQHTETSCNTLQHTATHCKT